MELTVREAATLMGRSPRTVRAQAARGDLSAEKRGGRWFIQRDELPLTEAQRRAFQDKADSLRDAVDEALPSRLARRHSDRHRSLYDLDAFRRGAEILREIRAAESFDAETGAALAATDLVSSIALALTFPRRRAQHLADADEAIVRLRTALRLARDLALISSRGLRYATGRLQAIGRMLGGWRKRVDKSSLAAPAALENTGDGPPPARNA